MGNLVCCIRPRQYWQERADFGIPSLGDWGHDSHSSNLPKSVIRNERFDVNRVTAILGLGVVAFAVTLAVYIGTHLSNEAMSVLTGAACGVGAMLPAAIIAAIAFTRRRERDEVNTARNTPPQSMYPPVIVVAPPALNPPPSNQSYMTTPPAAVPRQFTVIGDDALDSHSS